MKVPVGFLRNPFLDSLVNIFLSIYLFYIGIIVCPSYMNVYQLCLDIYTTLHRNNLQKLVNLTECIPNLDKPNDYPCLLLM